MQPALIAGPLRQRSTQLVALLASRRFASSATPQGDQALPAKALSGDQDDSEQVTAQPFSSAPLPRCPLMSNKCWRAAAGNSLVTDPEHPGYRACRGLSHGEGRGHHNSNAILIV